MAEIDIVPELLAQIQQDFSQAYKNDTKMQQLADKISSGKADYADAQEFAQRTGELMAAALQKNITADKLPNGQMYYNIADRILGTMLKTDYGIVAKKAAEVQQHLNENAGLGLKAQTADYDEENAKSIIDKVSAAEDFNTVSYMLKAPVETFSMKVVDDTIKKNADFHYKAGLKPRIVRTAESKCCDWCASLDGTYDYPGVSREVFRRHNNCRCTVNYDPRDGKVQNVWNKKEWKDAEEYDKIEARKSIQPEDDRSNKKISQRKLFSGRYFNRTQDMSPGDYALAVSLWNKYEEFPGIEKAEREHVRKEINRWAKENKLLEPVLRHQVNEHWYTVINKGFSDYKIIDRQYALEVSEMDEMIYKEVFGDDWRRYV